MVSRNEQDGISSGEKVSPLPPNAPQPERKDWAYNLALELDDRYDIMPPDRVIPAEVQHQRLDEVATLIRAYAPLPPPQARTPQNAPIDPNLNSGPTYDQLLQMLESIRGTLFAALEMKEISLDKCDRSAFEMATIASNGIFWRNKEIAQLREEVGRLRAGSAPQEAGARDKIYEHNQHWRSFVLPELNQTALLAGTASPLWNALEKQLAKEILRLRAERGVPLEETKK